MLSGTIDSMNTPPSPIGVLGFLQWCLCSRPWWRKVVVVGRDRGNVAALRSEVLRLNKHQPLALSGEVHIELGGTHQNFHWGQGRGEAVLLSCQQIWQPPTRWSIDCNVTRGCQDEIWPCQERMESIIQFCRVSTLIPPPLIGGERT